MKAVGYFQPLPIDHPEALLDLTLDEPVAGPHDLLVQVKAVSVNPVDHKVRTSRAGDGAPVVLGWDAVGEVLALGAEVRGFAVGERVWYAGALERPGTNAERHAVDARLVARAPARLSDAEAAALPLTAITAWELLFERLQVQADASAALLVTGGAGGVGSILLQLARQLTPLTVVATASRPETRDWCLAMGAHHVIDHAAPLGPQLQALKLPPLRYAASLTHTPQHYPALVEALAPQGRIGFIDDFGPGEVDLRLAKRKSLSLHWEMMFTRSLFATPDMAQQGRLLAEVAVLADAGRLRSTLAEVLGPLDAAHLRRAHARLEAGHTRGKLVLAPVGA